MRQLSKQLQTCLGKNQHGNAAIEFAIIAPAFFGLLFAGMDIGNTLYIQSILQGAVNKAARDTGLELGIEQSWRDGVDAKVKSQLHSINRDAVVSFDRSFFKTFSDAANPVSEIYDDTNHNRICDNGENYIDRNDNGIFDITGIATGQGASKDAVIYKVSVTYNRIFPTPNLLGWDKKVTLTASTVLANQPYNFRSEPVTRKCTS